MKHKWTKEDDLKVLYIYLYGYPKSYPTAEDVANLIGVSSSSLKMRIANFRYLDGKGGLSNYADLSKKVYDEYRSIPKEKLKELAGF
ncbi:hypothetical protein [Hydrogenothermus marinus]|uniref:Uncharacterized protein n=1 Tax=Hydrogenothermus marinus TaxID=133270 RepID=A0A3M0B7I4_9AQUI|nr:hypothetical protein [Hydrogenothermus marinus]RMA93057.1 hypothetical protein CLV39_1537 [Hydrogenothermus marinus]